MRHVINKLMMEIGCNEEDTAINLRHNFSHSFQPRIQEGIDKICNKYASNGNDFRIDKLEIDLGHFNLYTYDRHLLNIFFQKFEEALKEELANHQVSVGHRRLDFSKVEGFIYFLETGRLPWWQSSEKPDANSWFKSLINEVPSELIGSIKKRINCQRVWDRLALQLNTECHSIIIDNIPELKLVFDQVLKLIRVAIEELGWNKKSVNTDDLKRAIIRNYPQLNRATPKSFIKKIIIQELLVFLESLQQVTDEQKTALRKKILSVNLNKDLGERPDEKIEADPGLKSNDIQKEATDAEALKYKESESLDPESYLEKPIELESELPHDDDKYFTNHAGIVLLCQFLKPFFRNLRLTEDGKWKDLDCQFTAIHLLQYLATNNLDAAEYKLTFEKIICGLPVLHPVPKLIELTESQLTESKALLESIIEHWSALKNTSIEGLQHTFLQREGIIKPTDSGFEIFVERKTVDVLLDKLPWGYSLIMLPWNDYQIHVQW